MLFTSLLVITITCSMFVSAYAITLATTPAVSSTATVAPISTPVPAPTYTALFPFKHGGKVGFIDVMGKVVIEPKFDYNMFTDFSTEYVFKDGTAVVNVQGKNGIINTTGAWVVKPKYSDMANYSGGLASFQTSEGKCGFVDKTGKVVIAPQYAWAESFVGNYAIAQRVADVPDDFDPNQEALPVYGLIDKTGKYVIKPNRDGLFALGDGRVGVSIGHSFGYLDLAGNIVIGSGFDRISEFHNGLAIVGREGKFGVIDKAGKAVIPFEISERQLNPSDWKSYYGSYDFTDEFQVYFYKDKWTIFDKTGKISKILDANYNYVGEYKEGYFVAVTHDGVGKYLDKSGNVVFTLTGKSFGSVPADFSEGLCPAYDKDNKLGFINIKGEWVIKPQYVCITKGFKNGLATLEFHTEKGTKNGYMDKTGKLVYMEK